MASSVFDKYTTQVRVQSKFATDNPDSEPQEQGVYQRLTSDDRGQRSYVCQIHRSSCGSYGIYYKDIILTLFTIKNCIAMFYKHCTYFPTCFKEKITNDLVHVRTRDL